MEKMNIKRLENVQLALRYQKIEIEVYRARDAIIDTLKNILAVPKNLENVDHDIFNAILLKDYTSKIDNELYENFTENWNFQGEIEEEIKRRIDEIKKDPTNEHILYLCKDLAGTDITVETFLPFYRLIAYCKKWLPNENNITHLIKNISPHHFN